MPRNENLPVGYERLNDGRLLGPPSTFGDRPVINECVTTEVEHEPAPLGIQPEWAWRERRFTDLLSAVQRNLDPQNIVKPCLANWLNEALEHHYWLVSREEMKCHEREKRVNNVTHVNGKPVF